MTPCVVIPLCNDAAALRCLMGDLRQHAADWPVLIVDGGSSDGGAALAKELAHGQRDGVLSSKPGRGHQLRLGAEHAIEQGHDWLLFLHADSRVSGKLAAALERIADLPADIRADLEPARRRRRPPAPAEKIASRKRRKFLDLGI